MSYLNIFFISTFGGFGYNEWTDPKESSSVPYPMYGGTGWYIMLGRGFFSWTGTCSMLKLALYQSLVKASQS